MQLNTAAIVAVSGVCLIFLGLLCLSLIFPKLEKYLIEKETAMTEGTSTFQSWRKIPFPFKLKIYFFNVSNPDELQFGGKPKLQELGPYIYDEYRQREILENNFENDTIKFIQKKSYFFNQRESKCKTDNDKVTIINIGAINIANKIKKVAPMVLSLLNDGLPVLYPNIKNVFITDTVRNILFDGVKISCENEQVDFICEGIKSEMPPSIRFAENRIDLLLSLFHHINTTTDGPYVIDKGSSKASNKGMIVSFKDNNLLTQWSGNCNVIQGTDLTLNPNFWKKPRKIDFFASDFCRSFSVDFLQETDFEGLKTYEFGSKNLFRVKNNCYCGEECSPLGTMDIAPCSHSSIIISQPHFLRADHQLLGNVNGLEPNANKHATSILIEPKTGLALKVRIRFQMNLMLGPVKEVDLLANLSKEIFPFIWLEQGVTVPEHIIEEIRSNFSKLQVLNYVKIALILVGVVLLCCGIFFAMIKDKIFCLACSGGSVKPEIEQIASAYVTSNKKNFAWKA